MKREIENFFIAVIEFVYPPEAKDENRTLKPQEWWLGGIILLVFVGALVYWIIK